jgi:hypothetical protein
MKKNQQWVPITLNLFVHFFMYYYYCIAAPGKSVWWKKHLTTLQIVQFVLDVIVCYGCVITHYATLGFFPKFINDTLGIGVCHGEPFSAFFGCALLTSYLWLFVDFFLQTYRPRPKSELTFVKLD